MSPSQKKPTNQVRIIGGKWRSRKLNFLDTEALRPTPDRVRETLFNWLSPCIIGARCLDLFAGSGALSFEALSRGAGSVLMVDHSTKAIDQLKKNATLLNVSQDQLKFYCADALTCQSFSQDKFDIVFLDPPFYQNMIAPCFSFLKENRYLANNALIYVETERAVAGLPLLDGWEVIRYKITRQVGYWLVSTTE